MEGICIVSRIKKKKTIRERKARERESECGERERTGGCEAEERAREEMGRNDRGCMEEEVNESATEKMHVRERERGRKKSGK